MRRVVVVGALGLMLAACGLPFGIGQASTSQLINGAADTLAKAKSFEVTGTFTSDSDKYQIDLQYESSGTAHMDVTKGTTHLELLQINGKAYFRGKDFVASVAGTDTFGQALARAVGDKWFTSKDATPIDMSGFTDAAKVKANFLNTLSVTRKDNVTYNGQDTAELSDSDTILNITESSPYELLRLRTQPGKTVSGMTDADLAFSNYNKSFNIAGPTDVFQMDDPTTWPPYYVVTAVNLDRCSGDPCTVAATLKNNGGAKGAAAPSTVTFTASNDADKSVLGTCKATVSPDVANDAATSVSCSITGGAWTTFVQSGGNYTVNAVADNPAYD
jgi:hypothetical protein